MPKKLPDLSGIYIPKKYLPNHNGRLAEKINKDFAFSIGFFSCIDEKKFYAGSSIGKFAFPYASLDDLALCCQWVEWLFYIDDQFDENNIPANDPGQAIELAEKYILLLRKGITHSNNPVDTFSISLREKLLKAVNSHWFEHLCISTEEYLRIGVLGAVDVWRNKKPYTLEKYMLNREYDSGMYTCIDMIEVAAGIELSPKVRNDIQIQKLRRLATRHVAFANDIFSYNKEVPQHHNPNNLVYLFMHWKALSFEAAINEIIKILNMDMHKFLQLKEQILDSGLGTIPQLEKYILGMEHWMSGNIAWSQQTSRYKIDHDKNLFNTTNVF